MRLRAGFATCDGGLASAPSRRCASLRPGRAGLAALTAPRGERSSWAFVENPATVWRGTARWASAASGREEPRSRAALAGAENDS